MLISELTTMTCIWDTVLINIVSADGVPPNSARLWPDTLLTCVSILSSRFFKLSWYQSSINDPMTSFKMADEISRSLAALTKSQRMQICVFVHCLRTTNELVAQGSSYALVSKYVIVRAGIVPSYRSDRNNTKRPPSKVQFANCQGCHHLRHQFANRVA